MIKFEDSIIDSRLVDQGVYKVGDLYFNHKINALKTASVTKQAVSWDFNSAVYQQQAARPRLDVPVTMLYQQRAQQLRDQYDYIILAYSGGADSDQMLRSFVLNGIHIDEVWCDWPHLLVDRSGWRWDGTNAEHNIHMEYLDVIKPTLQWLSQNHPEIKIHQSDSFASLPSMDSPAVVDLIGDFGPTAYTGISRYLYINQYASELRAQGKNVAIVLGVDKCVPHKQGHDIGFAFHDYSVWIKSQISLIDTVIYEYFYWTPHMPEIVTEQAHQIWDVLKLNPEQTHRWLTKPGGAKLQRGSVWFDDVIKFTCYPHWDRTKFQVPKTGVVNNLHYGPMLDQFRNERWYQSWASNIVNVLIKQLDPKIAWRDGQSMRSDLKFFTNFVKIGTVSW
jgi:hypothetical protein